MKLTGCYPVWWCVCTVIMHKKKVARGLENEKCDWEKFFFCCFNFYFPPHYIHFFCHAAFVLMKKSIFAIASSHPHSLPTSATSHTISSSSMLVRVKLSTFLFFFLHSPEKKIWRTHPSHNIFSALSLFSFLCSIFFTFLINY